MAAPATASPIDALRAEVNVMLASIDASNAIAATVVFQVDPPREELFARNALALTEATRALPGCNVFSFHRAVKRRSPAAVEYLIYEDWETRRQFQRQWNSDHLKQFQAVVGDTLVGPPDLRFYTGWRRAAQAPDTSAMDELTSLFLLPLQLPILGMREVGRFLTRPRSSPERPPDIAPRRSGLSLGPSSPEVSPAPATGWGPIPYPVPEVAPATGATADLTDDFPFESHYQRVRGCRMHYVDEGSGDPILLLHGNPTWSFVWRHIIPHLTLHGRCVAPDLVGFGRSGKPAIEYHWFDHVRYLEAFVERLGLRNITLVLHDHGSGLGFHYAMRNPYNVKAIAFFEALVRPFEWEHFSTPEFRELFRAIRSGGVHGQGWRMVVDQNLFIEQLLPQASGRPLSPVAMRRYREPFLDPAARVPIWRFARETAIGGEPRDVWAAVTEYSVALQRSPIPKLLLYAEPGALLTPEHVAWCRRSLPNLQVASVGSGVHFLQESSPHEIGRAISGWLEGLAEARPPTYSYGR